MPKHLLYDSLNASRSEIRLLKIAPSPSGNSSVSCRLWKISMNDNPKYTALSYCWGDPEIVETITVNGTELSVTTNLVAFLRQFRELYKIRGSEVFLSENIWVDAICINQNNITERNEQVKIMGHIYSNADLVITWLGPGDDCSQRAMTLLPLISKLISQSSKNQDQVAWTQCELREVFCQTNSQEGLFHNQFWDSLRQLLTRPYWSRIWAVQEVALAKTLMILCGSDFGNLEDIANIEQWLREIQGCQCPDYFLPRLWAALSFDGAYSLLNFTNFATFWNIRNSCIEAEGQKLKRGNLDLVIETVNFCAIDPRDKVYGLLSLMDIEIEPNYSPSNLPKHVYTDHFKAYIRKERSLNLLKLAGSGIRSISPSLDLPSWVPNWNMRSGEDYGSDILMYPEYTADSFFNTHDSFSCSIKGDFLHCSGFTCEKILSLQPVPRLDQEDGLFQLLQACISTHNQERYVTGIPMFQAILRVLFFDTYPRQPKRLDITSKRYFRLAFEFVRFFCKHIWPNNKNLKAVFEDFSKTFGKSTGQDFMSWFKDNFLGDEFLTHYFPGWDCKEVLQVDVNEDSTLLSIYTAMALLSEVGKLFRTENGYLGIAPPGTIPEDLICILAGSNFPVVLRRFDTHYIHVGCCFILGFMDGEANDAVAQGYLSVQEYEIH